MKEIVKNYVVLDDTENYNDVIKLFGKEGYFVDDLNDFKIGSETEIYASSLSAINIYQTNYTGVYQIKYNGYNYFIYEKEA